MITVTALSILGLLVLLVYAFFRLPQFGASARGERKKQLERSPHFRNGQFHNLRHTPALAEGKTYSSVMREYLFSPKPRTSPRVSVPVIKSDLLNLDIAIDLLVWFGHSSYLLQVSGKIFVIDPVFSPFASPMPGMVRSFKGTNVYTAADMPSIDYLIITHDHYDHMDHRTLVALRGKVAKVITGLGVGAHLERWQYHPERVMEKDWYEEVSLDNGIKITATPSRHFSGRSFRRNTTLWTSFVLETENIKIYIGGDSGYDLHFREIGEKYGPFDLAILENGQYHDNWKYIHMTPEECVAAAVDLRAAQLLPVHWSKFSLAMHPWDDSIRRVVTEAKRNNIKILHPRIGEIVTLNPQVPHNFYHWWENIE
jgi:L-ascorbate metabolism protein UlaG (beta-lactamase superfamily)